MLVLTRKLGEAIIINQDIKVVVISIKNKQIRLGIEAPSSFEIQREELVKSIEQNNKKSLHVDNNLSS